MGIPVENDMQVGLPNYPLTCSLTTELQWPILILTHTSWHSRMLFPSL